MQIDNEEVAQKANKLGKPCEGVRAAFEAVDFDKMDNWGDAIKHIRKEWQELGVETLSPTNATCMPQIGHFKNFFFVFATSPTSATFSRCGATWDLATV